MKEGEVSFKEVKKSHPIVQKKIKKTLKQSIIEGSLYSICFRISSTYIAPYALAIGASSAQVGILGAFSSLLPSLSQLSSSRLIESYSRKKLAYLAVLLQAALWIPIILTALLFFNEVPNTIWILIGITGLFYIAEGLAKPPWFSLMGSLVEEKDRGKYFSRRNKTSRIFSVITLIIGAIFLDYMKKVGSSSGETVAYTLIGFIFLFTFALIARTIGAIIIKSHYEPKLVIRKKDHFTLKEFVISMKNTPIGRYTIFNTAFRFAVGIGSPFFTVYMISTLNLSYTWYMAITIAMIFYQILFFNIIGKVSDKFGNIELTKLSTALIALTPLIWAVSYIIPGTIPKVLYLIFFAQLINGIGWAGYMLCTNNYIYDAISQKKQGYAIAYMNLFTGLGFFFGAMLGSLIVVTEIFSIEIIVIIFLVSFIFRAFVAFFTTSILKEVREVQVFDPHYFLHHVHPLRGTITEFHHLNNLGGRIIHHI